MYDNKVRLSQDVLQKAELIAAEWGLKNARAAVEAVFRCYSDEYLHGRGRFSAPDSTRVSASSGFTAIQTPETAGSFSGGCEALDELDELLRM